MVDADNVSGPVALGRLISEPDGWASDSASVCRREGSAPPVSIDFRLEGIEAERVGPSRVGREFGGMDKWVGPVTPCNGQSRRQCTTG
jgi:hypothetical protein